MVEGYDGIVYTVVTSAIIVTIFLIKAWQKNTMIEVLSADQKAKQSISKTLEGGKNKLLSRYQHRIA